MIKTIKRHGQGLFFSFFLHAFLFMFLSINFLSQPIHPWVLNGSQLIGLQSVSQKKQIKNKKLKKTQATNVSPKDQTKENELKNYLYFVRAQVERSLSKSTRVGYYFKSGEVQVRVTLRENGQISRLEIMQSSGSQKTDETALDAISQSAPFPAYRRFSHSDGLNEDLTFIIPIQFKI